MLQKTVIVCLASVLAFSLIPLSILLNRTAANEPTVRHGVMDLASWDFANQQRLALNGEWEFYWNQLLRPEHFREDGAARPAPSAMLQVPSPWNGSIVDGRPLPAHGYATYRMVLQNVPFDGLFALKKMNIRFASAVYVNGQKLFEDGRPAGRTAGYVPGNTPQLGFFPAEPGDVEIIVQVANYDFANSGITAPIYFGEGAAMLAADQTFKAYEFSVVAVLLVLALTFLICYAASIAYRMRDNSLLLFAWICLFFAIYNGMVGERGLLMFLPGLPFEYPFKIKDICSMVIMIALTLYFYQLKQGVISLALTRVVIAVMGVHAVLIAALPIPVYSVFQPAVILLYQSVGTWFLIRTAILYIKSGEAERLKLFLLFMAVLCMELFSIDMILFSLSLKDNFWIGETYSVLFNLIILFMVVFRFFEAYRTVDAMKDQLLRLDKIKDDFLSTTSHELRTPLNAIVNITESLMRGAEGPVSDKQAHNLAIVKESGRRLTYLVNDLLDYSKMKHGDISLYFADVDVKASVDSVFGIHLFLLGGKRIDFVNEVSDSFPAVYADGNRLIQILHNLIGNAVKYSNGGEIRITAEVVRGMAEIRVSDTGVGISPHMRERIFLPFEQAERRDASHASGAGLGLSITKKLVELHSGSIRVDPVSGPVSGSVFTFTLPLAHAAVSEGKGQERRGDSEAADAPRAADYPMVVRGGKNGLILIVDDDSANLQTMINLLKLEGYSCIAANRGRQALDILAQSPQADLVILDLIMPDLSGYQILNKIRERYSPVELPVLMLTANNKVGEMKLSMEGGANDFVGKPFEAEELLARVRSLTRLKASAQEARAAEIAFLRSQINPHFLYNALNAIAELCVTDSEKAEALTLELSRYLRGGISLMQLDSLSTLQHELILTQAYVNIEKARFGDRLEVTYDVDADPDLLLPPLILQPLVENAIRHGLMSHAHGGRVTLTAKKTSDHTVRFEVADDGCGMSAGKLEEVLGMEANSEHVGLWNIRQRIKLLYATDIRMESSKGQGTKVVFEIPAEPRQWNGGV